MRDKLLRPRKRPVSRGNTSPPLPLYSQPISPMRSSCSVPANLRVLVALISTVCPAVQPQVLARSSSSLDNHLHAPSSFIPPRRGTGHKGAGGHRSRGQPSKDGRDHHQVNTEHYGYPLFRLIKVDYTFETESLVYDDIENKANTPSVFFGGNFSFDTLHYDNAGHILARFQVTVAQNSTD